MNMALRPRGLPLGRPLATGHPGHYPGGTPTRWSSSPLQGTRGIRLNDGFRIPGSSSAIPRSKIEYLLKNPFYIGQFRWKKRLYKGAHEQIVSRELFDKVQEVFASHGRDRGLYRVHEFAFGSLMRCGECGCTITAERHKGRYVYYRCTNYRRTCSQGFHREKALAEQFQRYVRDIQLPSKVAEWARDILKESLEQETDFHETAA